MQHSSSPFDPQITMAPRMSKRKKSRAGVQREPDHAEILGAVVPFLMSRSTEKIRDYLERGRRFTDGATSDLDAAWLAILKKLPENPVDPIFQLAWDDIEAELELRGREPPYKSSPADFEAFIRSVDALVTDKQETDPDDWDRMNTALTDDLRQFIKAKARAN
jgi:hypothetical protein